MAEILKTYNDLSKILKVIIQLFLGGWVSALYRIFKYFETKNTTTLIIGIVTFFIPILAIVDLVTIIMKNEITVLAD